MIRDEDLKSSIDYSEGQKKAAHRVLVELVNIFREYEEEIEMIKRDAYEQVQALIQLLTKLEEGEQSARENGWLSADEVEAALEL